MFSAASEHLSKALAKSTLLSNSSSSSSSNSNTPLVPTLQALEAVLSLEEGLAWHFFEYKDRGRAFFDQAKHQLGLQVGR